MVDIIGRDVLMTYVGEPAAFAYDPDATGLKAGDAVFTMGDQVAFGPLMYRSTRAGTRACRCRT